jgi:von Willebrand factor A domain-containing protein 8
VKRQTDGELDDSRLTEGLTGEATVYKRRSLDKPELGRPQIKSVLLPFYLETFIEHLAYPLGRNVSDSCST